MSTIDQLPEPELGYIKTDKSNQPAFSARQMREAVKHALQARAQVLGEVCPTCGETEPYTGSCGTSNNDTKALCKQPPQATQADVTDEQIISIKKVTRAADLTQPWGDTLAFARAILALRPAQVAVPMTREQMIEAVRPLCVSQETAESIVKISFDEYRAIEAFHNIGITAQAKKETP